MKSYAFVSLLYGDNPSYALSAAILGHSLRRAKTKHDMVLMYTDDVENVWLSICRSAGWTLRLVKHIKFQKELYPTGRFPHVFAKLHAVGMEKYDKVIVLDTDVLIRNDMDEPFERQTPAAVRRHPQGKYLDFAEIDCRHLFDGQRNQIGGINAGLMLLETSSKDFRRMEVQLATGTYLSRAGASESVRINMDYDEKDVHMVHFSRQIDCRDRLIQLAIV